MNIHQYVDTIVSADAISNYALQIQSLLKSRNIHSKIYARASLIKSHDIVDYRSPIPEEAFVVFHHSTYSPLVEAVVNLPNKKMLIYHNITPAAFFREFDYKLYTLFREAERQNELLRQSKFEAIIGDSKYNLSLIRKHLPRVKVKEVLPPFLNLQFSERKEDTEVLKKIKDENFNIIFVGRFTANKRQEDLIKVFEYYHNFINENSRLILIGGHSIFEPYCSFLYDYILKRELKNILIVRGASESSLMTYYRNSALFFSMSEHEGFCIPIIEALHYGIPILAYGIPAIRELINKKYLLTSKNYQLIGEIIEELRNNSSLRQEILADQKKVLRRFNANNLKNNFLQVLSKGFDL